MEIVSGRTGSPHVTSQQFRQLVEGTVGQESYILTSGENLEPELASNNILKIRSGMMSHHGNISSIKIGTYDEVELTNGSQGMKRIDLVVNRYTRNAETNVEANNWVVITGTPVASDPAVPAYTVGNLQEGDLTDDCPVFEVHYDGLNVTEIKKLLDVADNLGKMKTELAELNGNKPSFFHHELLWSGKLASKKTATGMSPNWSKYTLFVCRFDDGVSMALGIRCKDDSSSGWKDWIRFIGGNDSGSATDVYVASVMISGDTITASGVGSHALTSTGCPGVDRIMCEIYGII